MPMYVLVLVPRAVQERAAVPPAVLGELVLFLALSALLPAALDREWLPLLSACDAAPEFGFCASVYPLAATEVARLGRKAERRGDYVCGQAPPPGWRY